MQGVKSKHPPGAVAMITADTLRYTISIQSVLALKVPPGTVNAWNMGVLIAKSLNNAIQAMMDNPSLQWIWIMGDDHTFEPDCLLKLLDREVDVVAPLCLNRLPPMDPTIVEHQHKPTGRMKYLEDLPAGGIYKLTKDETCGDAGLLIRRHVLEKIGAPWYEQRISGAISAEDQAFIRRVQDHGFDVHIDMDVQIGHIMQTVLTPVRKTENGKTFWEIRLMGGGRYHVCDLGPWPRHSDDWRIAPEAGREAAE